MSWSNDRIPIWVAPVTHEGLDSWLAAYARRLAVSETDLLAQFGLPDARFEFMVRALTGRERDAVSRRTGVEPADLVAMTLESWNGLVVTFDPETRLIASTPPSILHSGRYSRFCPACLDATPGRWLLSWRLPWTFACTRHSSLLHDRCPRCGTTQRITKRLDVPKAGVCIGARGATGCGFPLSQSPSIELPAGGHVLRAQENINATVLGPSPASARARQRAKDLMVIAQRVLRSLPTHVNEAPTLVHQVLTECGDTLPTRTRRREASDAHNTAVGVAVADVVLDSKMAEHEAVFPWLMQANAAARAQDAYPITWAHGWYKAAGPGLATRALAAVDERVSWVTRIRYGTTTSSPAWPTSTEVDVQRRAAKVPAMLWPAWTMRVLQGGPTGHRLAGFRRGTASLLLLPGTYWTFVQASRLLGNNLTKTNWDALTEIVDEDDCNVLTTTLVLLARALDAHESPIDYDRRRALFTEGEVVVDASAFRAYCRRQGRLYNQGLYKYLLWLVRHFLLGAEPGSSSRSFAAHMNNAHLLETELRVFAHQQAKENLHIHGIDEPLLWEPPSDWLPALRWPGVDWEDINLERIGTQLAKRQPLSQVAESVGVSEDHIRLYLETTALAAPRIPPEPPKRSLGAPLPKQGILAPESLHKLYITDRMSTPKIAALVGCTPATIGRLLKEAGIPVRRREGPLRAADGTVVTADWLEREYVQLGRTTTELAEELDCHNAFVSHLLKRHGIPTRPLFGVASPFVRLGVPLSPAMQSVTKLRSHVKGLRNIIRLPGHHDIAAACRALGVVSKTVRYQLAKVEEAAGFTIIERTRPLSMTSQGKPFLSEGRRLLILLDRHSTASSASN
ncbi:TniQ family protein [Streptomyces diastatochromogenes]|uniref:TniQ family protein n=1 Tax=Streptomyces diastatochromogenes TaxID=42236 RepID=UPI0036B7914A